MKIELKPELVSSAAGPTSPAYLEILARGLEGNGIEIECATAKEAAATRARLYKARLAARKQGITSFDGVVIVLEDRKLFVTPPPTLIIRNL